MNVDETVVNLDGFILKVVKQNWQALVRSAAQQPYQTHTMWTLMARKSTDKVNVISQFQWPAVASASEVDRGVEQQWRSRALPTRRLFLGRHKAELLYPYQIGDLVGIWHRNFVVINRVFRFYRAQWMCPHVHRFDVL